MKVFQTLHAYPPYVSFFEQKNEVDDLSYEAHRKLLIEDRFYALHVLVEIDICSSLKCLV